MIHTGGNVLHIHIHRPLTEIEKSKEFMTQNETHAIMNEKNYYFFRFTLSNNDSFYRKENKYLNSFFFLLIQWLTVIALMIIL